MTNRNLARRNTTRPCNKKDGNGPLVRQRDYNARLEAAGFTRTDWNKWSYSWHGDFPVFKLAPGIVDDKVGLVAQCSQADKTILFSYGTFPADIKVRLDDEILEIVRLQADIADPLSVDSHHNDGFPHKLKNPVTLYLMEPATHCRIIKNYAGYRIDATTDRGKSYFHLDTCKTESEAKKYIVEDQEIDF